MNQRFTAPTPANHSDSRGNSSAARGERADSEFRTDTPIYDQIVREFHARHHATNSSATIAIVEYPEWHRDALPHLTIRLVTATVFDGSRGRPNIHPSAVNELLTRHPPTKRPAKLTL